MNELHHLDEFHKVLDNYQPSDDARAILAELPFVLFVGPSSSGRNTIINELILEHPDTYHCIISDTTRQPRSNNGLEEQNGREYWFRSEEELLADLQQGAFLEAAVIHNQQVSGISVRELKRALDDGKTALNEVEVDGADHIHTIKPDTKFLFILPPSFDEWMARITNRGQLPADELQRRLESAVSEITIGLQKDYYHFFVNNTFKQTTQQIHDFITTGEYSEEMQEHGLEVARQILIETQQHLQSGL